MEYKVFPSANKYFLIGVSAGIVLTLLWVVLFFSEFFELVELILSIIGTWILIMLFYFIKKWMLSFNYLHIRDDAVVAKTGILSTKRTIVPYRRITNVYTTHSILGRIAKVGTLEIDTAGSTGIEIRFRDIDEGELDKIVDIIKKQIGKEANEGVDG